QGLEPRLQQRHLALELLELVGGHLQGADLLLQALQPRPLLVLLLHGGGPVEVPEGPAEDGGQGHGGSELSSQGEPREGVVSHDALLTTASAPRPARPWTRVWACWPPRRRPAWPAPQDS